MQQFGSLMICTLALLLLAASAWWGMGSHPPPPQLSERPSASGHGERELLQRGRRGRNRGRGGGRGRRGRVHVSSAPLGSTTLAGPMAGLIHVGNASLDAEISAWLDARHASAHCSWDTPVWFAPTSPNGIGNKLFGLVMAFHLSLIQARGCPWLPRRTAGRSWGPASATNPPTAAASLATGRGRKLTRPPRRAGEGADRDGLAAHDAAHGLPSR